MGLNKSYILIGKNLSSFPQNTDDSIIIYEHCVVKPVLSAFKVEILVCYIFN